MNKSDIVNEVSKETGYKKQVVNTILNSALNAIIDGTVSNGKVCVGQLGTFTVVTKTIKNWSNPKTKQVSDVTVSKCNFTCSARFKDRIKDIHIG